MLFDEDKNFKTILSVTRYLYYDQQWQRLVQLHNHLHQLHLDQTCLKAFGQYQKPEFKHDRAHKYRPFRERANPTLFIYRNYIPPHIHIPHIFTSLIISCSSASEGFCPKDLITVASSWGANIYIHPFSCWFVKLSSLIPNWSLLLPIILGWR